MAKKLIASPEEMQGEIVIYQSEDGSTKIDVRFVDETVWLTQAQMADLLQSSRTNIVEHIQHICEEGELEQSSTSRKFRQVRTEGNRQVAREAPYCNLDRIISLGYRVKSKVATRFRRCAIIRRPLSFSLSRPLGRRGPSRTIPRFASRMYPNKRRCAAASCP